MPFSIAQVTPWPWEQHHEVNHFVERLADELCSRGHRVIVVAPSAHSGAMSQVAVGASCSVSRAALQALSFRNSPNENSPSANGTTGSDTLLMICVGRGCEGSHGNSASEPPTGENAANSSAASQARRNTIAEPFEKPVA